MKDEILMPCPEWAEKLAARHPEDISPSDGIALNNHIASCQACAAVHAAYHTMEINVGALPVTSLPGLPYERLRYSEKSLMSPLFSLLTYFGLFSRNKSQTLMSFIPTIQRSLSIKQSLFYYASAAYLLLILIVGAVELTQSPRPLASKFSSAISTPTAFADMPTLSNALSLEVRPINSLVLTLYRLCPDDSYPPVLQRANLTQQQRHRERSACRALQTEG